MGNLSELHLTLYILQENSLNKQFIFLYTGNIMLLYLACYLGFCFFFTIAWYKIWIVNYGFAIHAFGKLLWFLMLLNVASF